MPFVYETSITENSAIIVQHNVNLSTFEVVQILDFAKTTGASKPIFVVFGDKKQQWWQDTNNQQLQAVFIQGNNLVGLTDIIRSSAACLIFSEHNSNANQRDSVYIQFGIGDIKYFPIQNHIVDAPSCCKCM